MVFLTHARLVFQRVMHGILYLKTLLLYYLLQEEEHIKDTYNSLLKNHLNTDYNEKQYSKFTTGDKVAAAGIGGLLAASLGIKAFKAGGIAALLLILKKAWFVLFIPFIFAWGLIK